MDIDGQITTGADRSFPASRCAVAYVHVHTAGRQQSKDSAGSIERPWLSLSAGERADLERRIRAAGCTLVDAAPMQQGICEPGCTDARLMLETVQRLMSARMSEEIRKGLRAKAMRGGTIGRAPFGYRNVFSETNGRWIRSVAVDETQAAVVRQAFKLFATGRFTLLQLATEMRSWSDAAFKPGEETPAVPTWRLRRLLSNPYYRGLVTLGGVSYPGRHVPLVSVDDFKAVQRRLNLSGRRLKSAPRVAIDRGMSFLKGTP